jgi:multisubunit Na+/H+ antiporter MnhC subunit
LTDLFQRFGRFVAGTGSTLFIILGAILFGFGVPTLWIYLASVIYGEPGAITGSIALFIFVGIIVTYWLLLVVASWVRARVVDPEELERESKRASWNRSLRDTPFQPGESKTDPIEKLFIATAIVSLIGLLIWFVGFAGAPFPTG